MFRILVCLFAAFGLGSGLLFSAASAQAAEAVRPYPDPGYRQLGVYGTAVESHFDYGLVKLSLADEAFPEKKQWWAGLQAERLRSPAAVHHEIYLVTCGEREDIAPEVLTQRIDRWLKPEPEIPTYPELIPAICFGEENVPGSNARLEALAQHVRSHYGIPVFQWYSDPLAPNVRLTADGWIFDAYAGVVPSIWDSRGWPDFQFRKHLLEFVSFRKPVICVAWASDPHWPSWTQYPSAAQLANAEWHQFRACREFNVSCAVFAVAGAGSVNAWMYSPAPELVQLRNMLALKREEMHATRAQELPSSSANFSVRDRSVPVGGDAGTPSVYTEDFSGFHWIHDANIRGFQSLKLTSLPEDPGFLLLQPVPGRKVEASLTYRFESYFPLERVHVVLEAAAPKEARCRNRLALSLDETGTDWAPVAEQAERDEVAPLELEADSSVLHGAKTFYLRVQMENDAAQAGLPGNRLAQLRVACVHQAPPAESVAQLARDEYGNLTYDDDFSTARWRHLGRLEVSRAEFGGYRHQLFGSKLEAAGFEGHPEETGRFGRGQFWVGLASGVLPRTHLVQRFASPVPLKGLTLSADCFADGKDLGGRVRLKVTPRNGAAVAEACTSGVHHNLLQLEVPPDKLAGLQEFDVHVILESNSGVDRDDTACATLERLTIQAK